MSRAVSIIWLTVLWVLLWRDADPVNVAVGALLATLMVSVGPRPDSAGHRIRPLAAAKFVLVFAYKLIEANLVLAREVVTPKNHIETGILAIPLPGFSPLLLTLTGNAVSLTPGTLTIEASTDPEPVLYIHVLHLHDLEDARTDVLDIARLIRVAFGPAHALTSPLDPTEEDTA